MKFNDVLQLAFFLFLLISLTPPLGAFMDKVFSGHRTFLSPLLGGLEKLTYRMAGVNENVQMGWQDYALSLLWFNAVGCVILLALQLLQRQLPLNPQNFPNLSWHLAFNAAISFVTNTNWQSYSGENTMSYLTQMAGMGVQNFVSAATGIGVFLAMVRGLTGHAAGGGPGSVGNFWADLTRATVYILLPLSLAMAVVLCGQGVVQSLHPYMDITTLEGARQSVPLGPAASQIAIKQLGTNGGGFFNANSATPMENPTPLTNLLEMLALLLIPAALTYTFGRMVKAPRQGWTLFGVMFFVWVAGLAFSLYGEFQQNPVFHLAGVMEGKETRIGVVNSLIWSTATTVASNGSVNAMHASLSPIAGGVTMFNMMLGEVIFGGVGAGMYGILLFVLLTVFLSGLMVGRSPEYLGKKVEAGEIQMAILGILGPCAVILLGASVSSVLPVALSSLTNKGPHGLSEILYAFTSAAANNGSAFAGLNANTVYYNVVLGLAMLIGRFVVILPCLAIAGRMVQKKISPPSAGTFATDTPIFGVLLVGVIVVVGALTFLPALSLGPIVEHFLMRDGQTF